MFYGLKLLYNRAMAFGILSLHHLCIFGSLYIDKLRRFFDGGKLHAALLHIINYKVKCKSKYIQVSS